MAIVATGLHNAQPPSLDPFAYDPMGYAGQLGGLLYGDVVGAGSHDNRLAIFATTTRWISPAPTAPQPLWLLPGAVHIAVFRLQHIVRDWAGSGISTRYFPIILFACVARRW